MCGQYQRTHGPALVRDPEVGDHWFTGINVWADQTWCKMHPEVPSCAFARPKEDALSLRPGSNNVTPPKRSTATFAHSQTCPHHLVMSYDDNSHLALTRKPNFGHFKNNKKGERILAQSARLLYSIIYVLQSDFFFVTRVSGVFQFSMYSI